MDSANNYSTASSSSLPASVSGEEMLITPLGGGLEVGRSCILLQYQNRNIMLDCGCHPGREGNDSLPFFDKLENTEDIDLILITHFHIDHCAALPYFTEKTQFKGKIFMTHATKAVMKLLLSDNIRLQNARQALYNEQDLQNCMEKIEVIDYHQVIEYKGIKFTATAAGHVLGAAMFSIEIDNIKILYTGDYSMEEDRHLSQAELPPGGPPDVLIVESTFGTMNMDSRESREEKFTKAVSSIVSNGGSCLIPVFALGRAQELLLILDDFWHRSPELQAVPILYASKLATRSLKVYQTFVNMMNSSVRMLADQFYNPFKLKHIKSIANTDGTFGPCVVMASPGFLQSGVSRKLFEDWCDDERHGVIIAGYTVEGTLAHELLSEPREIRCLDNRIKPRRCRIEVISFSAHVDYQHNKLFISKVLPDYIVLVHGERRQISNLKDTLTREMKESWPTAHRPHIAAPGNGVGVRFIFKKSVAASIVGSAASGLLKVVDNSLLDADSSTINLNSAASAPLLVTENFASKVVAANELGQFTSCRLGNITEKFTIPIPSDLAALFVNSQAPGLSVVIDLLAEHLGEIFDEVIKDPSQPQQLSIQRLITLRLISTESFDRKQKLLKGVEIIWQASPAADLIADSVASISMQLLSAPQLLRMTLSNASFNLEKRKKSSQALKKQQKKTKSEPIHKDNLLSSSVSDGKLDPSRALPHDILNSIIHGKSLEQLKDALYTCRFGNLFGAIVTSADGNKLIFRGIEDAIYTHSSDENDSEVTVTKLKGTALLEGYVVVAPRKLSLEEEEKSSLDAAISCNDDAFHRLIIKALTSI